MAKGRVRLDTIIIGERAVVGGELVNAEGGLVFDSLKDAIEFKIAGDSGWGALRQPSCSAGRGIV